MILDFATPFPRHYTGIKLCPICNKPTKLYPNEIFCKNHFSFRHYTAYDSSVDDYDNAFLIYLDNNYYISIDRFETTLIRIDGLDEATIRISTQTKYSLEEIKQLYYQYQLLS